VKLITLSTPLSRHSPDLSVGTLQMLIVTVWRTLFPTSSVMETTSSFSRKKRLTNSPCSRMAHWINQFAPDCSLSTALRMRSSQLTTAI
jgi:hypothetical protein